MAWEAVVTMRHRVESEVAFFLLVRAREDRSANLVKCIRRRAAARLSRSAAGRALSGSA